MSNYQDSTYQSVYYRIWLGGVPLSEFEHTLVEEIVYEDNSSGSDLVSITIHDPDYLIIGDKRIVKSVACRVDGGFKHKYRTFIDGYVSAVDVDFPEEGFPTITIHVMDKSYIMNKIERKKVYKNMTYTAIASSIAKLYGLSFEGDTSGKAGKVQESITQSFETDIQFLTGLANEVGYLVYVVGSKLYFKDKEKFHSNASVGTLWYRRNPFDILSFRPRIIQADQLDEVEESDIDDKAKTTTTASAKNTASTTPAKATTPTATTPPKQTTPSTGGGSTGGGEMKYDPYTGKWTKV